jgi:hypothetical protein
LQARFPGQTILHRIIDHHLTLCAPAGSLTYHRGNKIHAGEGSKEWRSRSRNCVYLLSFDQVNQQSRQHGCVPSRRDRPCGCICSQKLLLSV